MAATGAHSRLGVAFANGVGLADCSVEGADVVVRVTDILHLPMGMTVPVTSSARAGPSGAAPLDS